MSVPLSTDSLIVKPSAIYDYGAIQDVGSSSSTEFISNPQWEGMGDVSGLGSNFKLFCSLLLDSIPGKATDLG
jgi:hypothetical protein